VNAETIGEPRQSVPGQAKDGATDALMQTSEIICRAAHCLTTGTKFRVVQHAPDACSLIRSGLLFTQVYARTPAQLRIAQWGVN